MATIDLVDDSSSEADEMPPSSPPPTRPSRPKLRTRRAIAYQEEDDDDANADGSSEDVEMRIALPARSASAAASAPRGRATRSRDDEGEASYEDAEEEEDDDMDDFVDEEEEEEEEEEEVVGRRRSSRTRKSVRRQQVEEEEDDDDDDDDDDEAEFKMQVQRAKRQSVASARRASRTPSTSTSSASISSSRKRKRPSNASGRSKSTSSSKSKSRSRGPRTRGSDEDEYVKHKSESDSENDEWLLSDDADAGDKGDESDGMDENAFIVEKILAREVHTRKGWARLRENRTTRFLQNGSIFIDDEDEEKEKDEAEGVVKETEAAATDDVVVVVVDGPTATPQRQEREEERFLIKWKNLSYIHVSWETEKNLLEVDRNVKGKIQRFREKEALGLLADRMHNGDEYFNPEFRDVDRILDIQDKPGDKYTPVDDEVDDDEDDDDDGEQGSEKKAKLKYMLIKWKAQPYDTLTWEREDDVHDDAAVKDYEARLLRAAMRYKRMASTKPSKSNSRKMPKFRGYSATNRPPFKEGLENMELRDYQLTGVNWMLLNWYQRRNSMLADEMGLGKTLQTVTYVNHLAVAEEMPGPYLIVAPLSTLGHWQREFANWTNLNAVVYHGSADARKMIQEFEFFLTPDEYKRAVQSDSSAKGGKLPKPQGGTCYRFDVLITTFEMCSAPDFAKLARVKWQLLVVDEAHRLKNRNSKLTLTIKKNFVYENILLLTGTPLQNNVEELWTLLHMLDEDRFDSMDDFMLDYGELKDMSQVEKLHGELKPFLLRRMKEDVEKSLAPKEETIIEVELTVLQKQYYRAIYEQNTEFLARGMKRSQAPSLMNVLMELRKCCNHPFLIRGMEQREIARLRELKDIAQEEIERQAMELLVTASGKLILLDKLLPRLQENGHRVLIFSQFKIMLDILQDYLRLRAYRCERIDGNITGNDRQAAIDRFCDPSSQAFIMLLSTRAGGVGINLTAADTVIIYDSDWNPQNDLQAQARCHRIGQKKSVKIYRLLTAKTYELHMFHQASLKLGLDQAVLGSIRDREQNGVDALGKTKRPNAQMSKDEIENLLKHGAYEMFKEDKDGEAEAASKRFSEESIDQILSRSTKIIHDPKAEDGSEAGNGKKSLMSSFSKATFVSSDDPDAQVALDDPDFWTKVVGLQAPEKVEPSPLKKRRCRRQVKTYLQEDSADENDKLEKKRGPGRPRKANPDDQEEFVISSSSDDDDDDDDDDNDFAAANELDDFEPGKNMSKKEKKQRQSAKLHQVPLYLYKERVGDLLTTFGYGRWDEMVADSPFLAKYPREELVTFTREYIASLVRVAATSYLTARQLPPPPLPPLAGGHGAPAAPPPPMVLFVPATKKQLDDWLNGFANKFRVVESLLTDLSLQRFSDIPITTSGLLRRAQSMKAEREATTKVQQIDRMQQLQAFVRTQIGPIEPMMVLLRRFPKDQPWNRVQDMLMDCEVPPPLPGGDASTLQETPVVPAVDDVAVPDEKIATSAEGDSNNADAKQKTVTDTAEVNGASEHGEEKRGKGEADEKGSALEKSTVDETKLEAKVPGEVAVEVVSAEPSADAGPSDGETKKVEADGKLDDGKPTKESDMDGKPDAEVKKAESDAKPVDAEARSPVSTTAKAAVKFTDAQLRVTMTRLQMLPDVGSALAVSPWWVSIIDDVSLILYVYKHGWIKARTLPTSLVNDDLLFGSRAAPYEAVMWPTVVMLNKRMRNLLATWTNARRLAAHANAVTLRRRIKNPKAPTATTLPGRVLIPPTLPLGMGAPLALSGVELRHEPASVHGPELPQNLSKRGRFAKLVYSVGVPDTRLCTTEKSRQVKWRHFTTDAQLNIGACTLEELRAEVEDLERFCRLRSSFQGDPSLAPMPPLPEPRVRSILGSWRGNWSNVNHYRSRRVMERITLFHTLRAELLPLPGQQLVDILKRVIRSIMGAEKKPADHYPSWWQCPRHDIKLLQAVELHGMDENLDKVWKIKAFAESNPSGEFPSATWVENHMTSITTQAHELIQKFKGSKSQGPTVDLQLLNQQHVQQQQIIQQHVQQQQIIQQQIQQRQIQQQQRLAAEQHRRHQQQQQRQQLQQQEQQRLQYLHQKALREQLEAQLQQQQRLQEQQRQRSARSDALSVVEARQRLVNIYGMRKEDPEHSPRERERKAEDTRANYVAKEEASQQNDAELTLAAAAEENAVKVVRDASEEEQPKAADIQASAREMMDTLKEVRLMKSEDPYYSTRVGSIWVEQRKRDLEETAAKTQETTTSDADGAVSAGSAAEKTTVDVIELDDEDEVEGEEKAEEKEEVKDDAMQTTPPSQHAAAEPATPQAAAAESISPQKEHDQAMIATPGKAPAASASVDHSPSDSVSSSGQKRKRVPRAWEVIVIDDSDDEDEDDAPVVKRTTRSRRRRRGESLADGL